MTEDIVKLVSTIPENEIDVYGGKIKGLWKLRDQELIIPTSWGISSEVTDDALDEFWAHDDIDFGTNEYWAVRSSGLEEDGSTRSFAGQFSTELGVKKSEILEAVKKCRSQGFSTSVGILIQPMIEVTYSGVCFSVDPIKGEKFMICEWIQGCGIRLVDGSETPSSMIVNKDSREVIELLDERQDLIFAKSEGDWSTRKCEENVLKENIRRLLIEKTLDIECYLGYPVDIEWGWEGKDLYVFQVRPITT